jgi:hypothetical protein
LPTSALQFECLRILARYTGHYRISENTRPVWLVAENGSRLELDLYVEDLAVAFEIQGDQHYSYCPHFHKTYERFEAQQSRDECKRITCAVLGIRLFEIHSVLEMESAIERIKFDQFEYEPLPKYDIALMLKRMRDNLQKHQAELEFCEKRYSVHIEMGVAGKQLRAVRGALWRKRVVVRRVMAQHAVRALRAINKNEGYGRRDRSRCKKSSFATSVPPNQNSTH